MSVSSHYIEQQLKAVWRQALRNDLSCFLRQGFQALNQASSFEDNWHIDAISEYLRAVERRDIKRLIINMPPRYLKSIAVSVAWPAWLLGQNPHQRVLVASYAQSLSLKHSLDSRHLLQSSWFRHAYPETQIMSGQNEKQKFVTTAHGFRLAVSVGGSVTGEGGDILIVDDPLNPQQAESALFRNLANRWFEHTFSSRLNDKRNGAIVVVMQRLHAEDLSGFLLEKGGWEHLNLPAISSRRRYFFLNNWVKHLSQGELLHEHREDGPMLERLRHEMGSYAFNAQYLQEPVMREGGLIKSHWFGRFSSKERAVNHKSMIVQSWDTAIKTAKHHDPSVCITLAVEEGNIDVLDVLVERLEYPQLRRMMISQAERWSPNAVLVEDKASGQSLLQDLRQSTQLPVIAMMPDVDKLTRFVRVTPVIEAGRVRLPRHAPWLAAFEQELLSFPDARHDDQVDALSQALNWLRYREAQGTARVRTV